MTRKDALTFIREHGACILLDSYAEEIARAFGWHSLDEIGVEPHRPPRPMPGLEGSNVVAMPFLAAALSGLHDLPVAAMEGVWNAISQFAVDRIEQDAEDLPDAVRVEITFEEHGADEGNAREE